MNWRSWKPTLLTPHARQIDFLDSPAKRKIIRAGRRGGKTVGVSILACRAFLAGKRVLYATPTQDQLDSFWRNTKRQLQAGIDNGALYKNESLHIIDRPGTDNRIRGKTAWNAEMLRGDYSDVLILDEYQLMNEDTWGIVGAPMLLDNNGDAVFIYTPPSLHSRAISKAMDKRHAAKMFKRAAADTSGRWATFHFSSHENPYISAEALAELTHDMTARAILQEIEAQDIDDVPGALWTIDTIDKGRVDQAPELTRIVTAIDPSASSKDSSDEAGIIVAGRMGNQGYVLADETVRGTPLEWANRAIAAHKKWNGDRIVGEGNNGGEMVEAVLRSVDPNIPYLMVTASRGKATRAEPVSALYEQVRIHHVGIFALLEEEMTSWKPGEGKSPNRVDALVWVMTELGLVDDLEGYGETVYADPITIDSTY